jgi:alkylated DNA nucleotide flippase Atl1
MGCALAAGLVVAGAPTFGSGLRALRLRRRLRRLATLDLSSDASGFGQVKGRVALESPLVGPLSAKPCAGFVLEVLTESRGRVATLEDRRAFRLIGDGVSARVVGADLVAWDLEVTAERVVRPGDSISQNLTALFEGSAEVAWVRHRGGTVRLIERALLAGQSAHVIGRIRAAHPHELPEAEVLARTGTDDVPVWLTPVGSTPEADLWIEPDGPLDYLRVFDHLPTSAELSIPMWRVLGVALGPTLALAGLLYLARAADRLRDGGF